MKKYQVLKDITFNDVWELEPGQFRDQCIKRLIDCGFIEEKKLKFYKLGQRFKGAGNLYILSKFAQNQVTLINLEDGNAWHYGGKYVKDTSKITKKEFSEIIGNSEYKFELSEREEV